MNIPKLMIDSPFRDSSLIYSSSFYCMDPVMVLDCGETKIGWFPSTEIEKARQYGSLTEYNNLSEESKRLKKTGLYPALKSSLIIERLKAEGITKIAVPASFPVLEADNLREAGIELRVKEEPFYPERVVKSTKEIDYIAQNSAANVAVMDEVKRIIADSSVNDRNILVYEGQELTAEFLQGLILRAFIDRELTADSVITAVGDQGCNPHEYGSGPIYANTSIIVDIYPRNRNNLYFTDMTRTFCKGSAGKELKEIYQAVLDAQLFALDEVKAGVDGKDIHEKVYRLFEDKGYKTGVIDGSLQGFFHGTGHGLGLDCHEAPNISTNSSILQENSLVTVEPGLYYLGKGAVRIEDLVVVEKDGCRILTEYEKILEID